jgi:hypothetical protein
MGNSSLGRLRASNPQQPSKQAWQNHPLPLTHRDRSVRDATVEGRCCRDLREAFRSLFPAGHIAWSVEVKGKKVRIISAAKLAARITDIERGDRSRRASVETGQCVVY